LGFNEFFFLKKKYSWDLTEFAKIPIPKFFKKKMDILKILTEFNEKS
jgi:hypothetical protein